MINKRNQCILYATFRRHNLNGDKRLGKNNILYKEKKLQGLHTQDFLQDKLIRLLIISFSL